MTTQAKEKLVFAQGNKYVFLDDKTVGVEYLCAVEDTDKIHTRYFFIDDRIRARVDDYGMGYTTDEKHKIRPLISTPEILEKAKAQAAAAARPLSMPAFSEKFGEFTSSVDKLGAAADTIVSAVEDLNKIYKDESASIKRAVGLVTDSYTKETSRILAESKTHSTTVVQNLSSSHNALVQSLAKFSEDISTVIRKSFDGLGVALNQHADILQDRFERQINDAIERLTLEVGKNSQDIATAVMSRLGHMPTAPTVEEPPPAPEPKTPEKPKALRVTNFADLATVQKH